VNEEKKNINRRCNWSGDTRWEIQYINNHTRLKGWNDTMVRWWYKR